jgi:hypothetical protein
MSSVIRICCYLDIAHCLRPTIEINADNIKRNVTGTFDGGRVRYQQVIYIKLVSENEKYPS